MRPFRLPYHRNGEEAMLGVAQSIRTTGAVNTEHINRRAAVFMGGVASVHGETTIAAPAVPGQMVKDVRRSSGSWKNSSIRPLREIEACEVALPGKKLCI